MPNKTWKTWNVFYSFFLFFFRIDFDSTMSTGMVLVRMVLVRMVCLPCKIIFSASSVIRDWAKQVFLADAAFHT